MSANPIVTNVGRIAATSDTDGDKVQSVGVSGTVPVRPLKSPTVARSNVVVDDTAAVTLIATNTARGGFGIHNHSDGQLYVSYGGTAGATDFTQVMQSHSYLENSGAGVYTGSVSARRPTGEITGPVFVTEWSE